MRKSVLEILLLCSLSFLFVVNAFAQTGNGQLGGIVQDPSKALIPGVSLTLTNSDTGVTITQISNESGAYQFQSVPPGNYKLTAELPGFRQAVANGVVVGTNAQVRRDFTLEIGNLSSQVEVAATADQLLTESSASVGQVLPAQRVRDLPVVGNNVLDLLKVLPGFREGATAATATVGGLGLDTVNATVNGLSTNSSRDAAQFWGYQTFTTNVINTELVGEIRLILAPVDAELGRGNSQIQIQTKSGTNRFTGSAVWNVQNTALNANTWANNRTTAVENGVTVWKPTKPSWQNVQEFSGSYSGPIIKNKTFFFFLYDQQFNKGRDLFSTQVLTDSARNGVFRYWSGWNSGNAQEPFPTAFTNSLTATYPSIDFAGNPVRPLNNPDGTPYTGALRCFSVFGATKFDGTPFGASDCPGGTAVIRTGNLPWDPLRPTADPTGYFRNLIAAAPRANFFATFGGVNPDGLNTGIYRYVRPRDGAATINATIGVVQAAGDFNNRKQTNLKIDHNFTDKHRVSVGWTNEWVAGIGNGQAAWPGGLNGGLRRRPQLLTVNGTSTLSSTLLNEARFGVNYSSEWASPAWSNLNDKTTNDAAREFLLQGGKNPTNGKVYPIIFNPGANYNGLINYGSFDFANTSPLWDYADTLRWTRGKHAFSMGGNYRRPMTTGFNGTGYPSASPGNPAGSQATATPISLNLTNYDVELPGFRQTARNNAASLLYALSGSLGAATTQYWINGHKDIATGQWIDTTLQKDAIQTADPNYGHQARTQISNEWSFFFKDDFKISNNLTLNLGARYDYNMSPYLRGGLTNRFIGDGEGLFGAGRPTGGDIFQNWLTPGNLYLTNYGSLVGAPTGTVPLSCAKGVQQSAALPASNCDPNLLSTIQFVGKDTPNPDETLVPQSGRLSPALGFAYQLPFFGAGKTTVRGGFQRTYGTAGSTFSGGLLSGPGGDAIPGGQGLTLTDANIASILATRPLFISDLPNLVPTRVTRQPGVRIPTAGRAIGIAYSMYDKDYVTPYTDNFTLSVTRSVSRNLTVDVRLVDTIGKKLPGTGGSLGTPGSFNINTPNVYHNPELFAALERTRAGQDDPLFDQMLIGLNLNPGIAGYGAVGQTAAVSGVQVLQRGSAHIRRAFAANLANGDYNALIGQILGFNPTSGAQALPIDPTTGNTVIASQRLLRNGCDRIANGLTTGFNLPTGQAITPRCFPENYLIANQQLGAANYAGNYGRTHYASMETQLTVRNFYGIALQGTYSFSKTMEQPGSGYTDPLNREMDYRKASTSSGHEFRANGTVELPIGPNKLLLGNTAGLMGRLLERWETSFILNLPFGGVRTLSTGSQFLYGNGRPDIVGPWDNPKGHVTWKGNNGSYFGEGAYVTFQDPQCTQRVGGPDANGFNLQTNCTLRGLAASAPAGTAGAITLPNGSLAVPLLQNPLPGKQGTLGAATMFTHGRWALDGTLAKSFQITESKALQLRIDATNILNHPTPLDPIGLGVQGTNFSSDNFGQITSKTGNRTFQGKLRLSF
jgi:hypothetical protein